MFLLDQGTNAGLDDLLKEYGLIAHNDSVFDPRFGASGRPQIIVINSYKSHTITQNMMGQSSVLFAARSFAANTAVLSYTLTSLFSSSDQSWGETDFDSIKNQTAKFDDGKDFKGPLDLGFAIEGNGAKPTQIVVLGNSTSLANNYLNQIAATGQQTLFGYGQLFFNVVRWFVGQGDLITIPPKATTPSQLNLTAEDSNFVLVFSIVLLPLIILLIGGVVWWRRR